MAQGENAKINNGKEWWGKRTLNNTPVSNKKGMKFWKKLLHKIERRIGKQDLNNDWNG